MNDETKKQPVVGCWYYDHNVCGLPHPSPVCEEHDAAIRKDEREKVLKAVTKLFCIQEDSEAWRWLETLHQQKRDSDD